MAEAISVTVWGVRGSMPCTDQCYQEFGGNTISLEVCVGGRTLVVDMGSGVRPFGQKLYAAQHAAPLPVLFSHLHLDHVLGLPFFAPMYDRSAQIDFYSANQYFGYGSLRSALQKLCAPPFFPVEFSAMPAQLNCHDFVPGQVLYPFADVPVQTVEIPHPGGCIGYRFDHQKKSLGLLCDMMPIADHDAAIVEVMSGVDALIIDAAYSDAQYATREHWGHCSWSYALNLARKFGAPPVYIIHHDILNHDTALHAMQQEASAQYDRVTFVQEGLKITV